MNLFLIYERSADVVEHLLLHRSQAQHSTAQHSAISPAQSSKPSTCRSERDDASKQTESAIASMSSCIHTARCVPKTNEEIQICRPKKIRERSQSSVAGVIREGLALIYNLNKLQHCSSSPSFLWFLYDTCMRRPGCFAGSWSSSQLQVVSLHLVINLCPLHSHCVQFFLVSERSGRKPPAQRSTLCCLVYL